MWLKSEEPGVTDVWTPASCLILPVSLSLPQTGSSPPTSYLPTSSAQGQAADVQFSLPLCSHLSKVSWARYLQVQPAVGGAARSLPRMLRPTLYSAEDYPPFPPRLAHPGGGHSTPLLSLGLPMS